MPGREDGQNLWLTPTHPQVERPLIGLGPFGRVSVEVERENKRAGETAVGWLVSQACLLGSPPPVRRSELSHLDSGDGLQEQECAPDGSVSVPGVSSVARAGSGVPSF